MTEYLQTAWPILLALVERGIAIGAGLHVLLNKRDSRATISWVGLIWLAPVIGSLLYFVLGINRIARKGTKLQNHIDAMFQRLNKHQALEQERVAVETLEELAQYRPLKELVGRLTSRPLTYGNHVIPLFNGDEAYPVMLAAIASAQKSISLVTYIFDYDATGREFVEALVAAHHRGVKVRVLIDGVGSRYSRPNTLKLLRRHGVPSAAFLPTFAPGGFAYANLRNHRKIMVIDGCTGFTGGMNIREGCRVERATKHLVQDMHFKIAGPVVAHLQKTFLADWAFAAGELLDGDEWLLQDYAPAGLTFARGVPEGPDEDSEKLVYTMIEAINIARKRIVVTTPYFLPEQFMLYAIGAAAMRGVEVEFVVPEKNNLRFVQWASSSSLYSVLEMGCRVFLSPPPFDHSKLMLVDDAWVLFGSTNWDPRSFHLNFEFNVECYDTELNRRLTKIIDMKIAHCREITLETLEKRSFPVKVRDGLARLLTPYL
ncbi:MAG TPA: cardiolipin synthase [Pirellulaceae bacterium]|nr:cardiolipin synthase [Pirellulaceae bacterium]HMO92089.1 cardiolipin synthase [Pirellulaceae bacterium]HMP69323.1 cardiolipin synthase [Pirellulaceae bacterium]